MSNKILNARGDRDRTDEKQKELKKNKQIKQLKFSVFGLLFGKSE